MREKVMGCPLSSKDAEFYPQNMAFQWGLHNSRVEYAVFSAILYKKNIPTYSFAYVKPQYILP